MAAISAALRRRAVERAVHIEQTAGKRAVCAHFLTAKGIQHRLRAGRRIDFEHGAAAVLANDDGIPA